MWLAWEATSAGRLMWKLIPKIHYWMELAFQANAINPLFVTTYSGESMVGRVMNMYKRFLWAFFHRTIQMKI